MISEKRITVIVHGPEAVDSGLALHVIEEASRLGQVKARVGGATAVAAVIDASLEGTIAIDSRELPSLAIKRAVRESDLILLVNLGKDRGSALAFGRLVMSKTSPCDVPVVQMDGGMNVIWSGVDQALSPFQGLLRGEVLDMRDMISVSEANVRRLSGVRTGEHVSINGNVIGRATGDEVVISQTSDGELIAEGVAIKPAGVDRLGMFDVRTAIIRSGQVRRTRANPRSLRSKKEVAYLIDHCAEESVYRCRDAAYVVTVGDDTSKIASSLLFRLGIPVIAITDGDEDGISDEEIFFPGSYYFRLKPGNDDLVGAMVRRDLFKDEERLDHPAEIEEMAVRVRAMCVDKLAWEKRF